MCIQESHLRIVDSWIINSCWGMGNVDFEFVPSLGRSGGIISIWDANSFLKESVFHDQHFLAIKGRWLQNNKPCGIINVYAPNSLSEREALWSKLSLVVGADQNLGWVIGGDFNEVRRADERCGSTFVPRGAAMFNNFIASLDLVEPSMGGRKYTWASADGQKCSKLDRFLLSRPFLDAWSNPGVFALPRWFSDHNPITLDTGQLDFGHVPFKFFNSWINIDSLAMVVSQSWTSWPANDSNLTDIQRLCGKLKRTKEEIKRWRKDVCGGGGKFLEDLKKRYNTLEMIEDSIGLSDMDRSEMISTLGKIRELEERELQDAKQKAKVGWLKNGDENSRFFHGIVNNRRAKKWVHGLSIDGIWTSDPSLLKSHIFNFFQDKFKDQPGEKFSFRSSFLRKLSRDQSFNLEAPITNTEVKNAVWSCGGDKAPGPDGFSFAFLRKFWELVGNDFYKALKDFEDNPSHIAASNASFIALVPKAKDPLRINENRPIHLMGCVSKVISKVLADRLKLVVGDIISPVQTAFVKGRQILDGPLIVNEIISWAKRLKNKLFIFKVDFEKAFDNIRWNFLWEILDQMNFGRRWISWIKGIICTAKVSVLVNGSPTNQFGLEKGVRQGDPLSPYLFIIAMEGLVAALKEASDKNLLSGVVLPNQGPSISSLHYADDAIFLGKWNEANLRNLLKILKCFHLASGLKINWCKSTLLGTGVPMAEITRLALAVGCKEGKFPFFYLGIPIGASMVKKENWKPLLERFNNKLSSWKAATLSVGGRLTLCKAVLGSLGVYYLSLFKAPIGVVQELERKRMSFFWGSTISHKKMVWVSWDKILNDRDKGGLGIGSIRAHNLALLTKWWWRFKTEKEAMWCKVITSLHGEDGNLGGDPRVNANKGVWGAIVAVEKTINSCPEALAKMYPRLAALDIDINCSLADRVTVTDGISIFRGCWRRTIRPGREINEVAAIENVCRNLHLGTEKSVWTWALTDTGLFSVSSLRYAIDDMLLRRLPTKANLLEKGLNWDTDTCPLCSVSGETGDHLFITCRTVVEVRRRINVWWNCLPSLCNSVRDFFEEISSKNQPDSQRLLKEAIGQAYVWAMWKGRNELLFNNKAFNILGTANWIQSAVFLWCNSRIVGGSKFNWFDWSCNPSLISSVLTG
ncbi:hypothetical protein OSB04_024108 [Centaurea solstitialis]|uniref:Reverse transcriptase domain-containing protein n=1 Tax=Centaurea solstitialis TaxID=347529 RepID=A0AA38WDK0_9ASTR|nr:hypothetical protein OSB04_024108 [Centaurea solstitialis]